MWEGERERGREGESGRVGEWESGHGDKATRRGATGRVAAVLCSIRPGKRMRGDKARGDKAIVVVHIIIKQRKTQNFNLNIKVNSGPWIIYLYSEGLEPVS